MSILSQLERDLFEAAKRRLPAADDPAQGLRGHGRRGSTPEPRWPRFRRRLSASAAALPMLIAIGVTVGVTAVALTAFQQSHAPIPTAGAGSSSSSREQLIQTLGVLRRPQTKADRESLGNRVFDIVQRLARRHRPLPAALKRALARWGHPEPDRPLVRAVNTALVRTVSIAPTTYQPSLTSSRRAEGLTISIENGSTGSGPTPTSVATLQAHGLGVFTFAANDTNRGVVIVPDGVARVTLGSFRLTDPPAAINPSEIVSAISVVHENVAAFQLKGLTATATSRRQAGLYGVNAVAQMTWFAANGKLIRHTTTNLSLVVNVHGRTQPPRHLVGSAIKNSQFCLQNPHAC